ncbi:hypothetical protein BJY52DRAFT_1406416 [Lactarius psammicola]|nr:hypothetical protein BJY52DRAFT_1406416 [Lactarius psammicola]
MVPLPPGGVWSHDGQHHGARAHVGGRVRAPRRGRCVPLWRVPPDAAPGHYPTIPVRGADVHAGLSLLVLRAGPPELWVHPHHAVLQGDRAMLDAFDASTDVLVFIAHDASWLDVLEPFPATDLVGREKWGGRELTRRDADKWRFLVDFRRAVNNSGNMMQWKSSTSWPSAGGADSLFIAMYKTEAAPCMFKRHHGEVRSLDISTITPQRTYSQSIVDICVVEKWIKLPPTGLVAQSL